MYVDDIKLAGKTENLGPTWKILMKDVDLEEPTSFLDHVHLGCTQRECTIRNDIVTKYRDVFESRISAGAKRKIYRPELQGNLMQKSYLLGPTTWKVMQGNVWKDIANLRIRRLNSFSKSQRHAWITINLKKKMSQLENCVQYAHKLFSNVCIWLELCLKNACMNAVHMKSPHDNHDHDHEHDHLHDTTTKGWRFGGSSPWMSHHPSGSWQGHPRYTGAVTTEGRGWPVQRPTGQSHAQ